MIKNLKVMLVFSLILSFFISCTEDMEPVLPDQPPVEVPQPDDENNNVDNKPGNGGDSNNSSNNNQNAYELGNGSGNLVIDGTNAAVLGRKFIVIKGGTYGSITIKNLSAKEGDPIVIKNLGKVIIKGGMFTENITNVTISGDNTSGLEYGFNLHDISYRGLSMSGKMSGVILKSLSFKNIGDYTLYADIANQSYQGSSETRTERFKIINCKFDNASGIQISGNFGSNQDNGFIKNLEIAHNIIINSDAGVFAFVGNVEDYDIHHNTIDNLNPRNNNHNGIFQMVGNGKFHNNKFTNYQGNMIRAWAFSRGTSPSTLEFYNNIGYNTRKYGAFEIQGFDRYIVPGKSTFVNAKVYKNTVGKMNTSKDWEGVILDLYNYGGTLEYYNNLGFDLNQSRPITDMINNMSDVRITKNSGNKYFKSGSDAVSNTTQFISKHANIGASL